eukprot:PhM_4_TR14089/c1_g1_i1/m.106953/K10590/TRIP12; E3 ubiquitin-protein ligase TRIP12
MDAQRGSVGPTNFGAASNASNSGGEESQNPLLRTLMSSTVTSLERVQACADLCTAVCIAGDDVISRSDVPKVSTAIVNILTTEKHNPDSMLALMVIRLAGVLLDTIPRTYASLVAAGYVPALLRVMTNGGMMRDTIAEEITKCLTALSMDAPQYFLHKQTLKLLLDQVTSGGIEDSLKLKYMTIVNNVCAKARWSHAPQLFAALKTVTTLWASIVSSDRATTTTTTSTQPPSSSPSSPRSQPPPPPVAVSSSTTEVPMLLLHIRCATNIIERLASKPSHIAELLGTGVMPLVTRTLGHDAFRQHFSVFRSGSALFLSVFRWNPTRAITEALQCGLFDAVAEALRISTDALGEALARDAVGSLGMTRGKRDTQWMGTMQGLDDFVRHWMEVFAVILPPVTSSGTSEGGLPPHRVLTREIEVRTCNYVWSWEDDYHNLTNYDSVTSQALERSYDRYPQGGVYLPHVGSFPSVFYFGEQQQVALDGSVARKIHRGSQPSGTYLRVLHAPNSNPACICTPDEQGGAGVSSTDGLDIDDDIHQAFGCCGCLPFRFKRERRSSGRVPKIHVVHGTFHGEVPIITRSACEDIAASRVPSQELLGQAGLAGLGPIVLPLILDMLDVSVSSAIYRDGMVSLASLLECSTNESPFSSSSPSPTPSTNDNRSTSTSAGFNAVLSTELTRVLRIVVRALHHCQRRAATVVVARATSAAHQVQFSSMPRLSGVSNQRPTLLTEDGQVLVACTVILNYVCLGSSPDIEDTLINSNVVEALLRVESAVRSVANEMAEAYENLVTTMGSNVPTLCPMHRPPHQVAADVLSTLEATVSTVTLRCRYGERDLEQDRQVTQKAAMDSARNVHTLTRALACVPAQHVMHPQSMVLSCLRRAMSIAVLTNREENSPDANSSSSRHMNASDIWENVLESLIRVVPEPTSTMFVPTSLGQIATSGSPTSSSLFEHARDAAMAMMQERLTRVITIKVNVFQPTMNTSGCSQQQDDTYVHTAHAVLWSTINNVALSALTRPGSPYAVDMFTAQNNNTSSASQATTSADADLTPQSHTTSASPPPVFDVYIDGQLVSCRGLTLFECLIRYSLAFTSVRKLLAKASEPMTCAMLASWRNSFARALSALNAPHQVSLYIGGRARSNLSTFVVMPPPAMGTPPPSTPLSKCSSFGGAPPNFDALVEHLETRGIRSRRVKTLMSWALLEEQRTNIYSFLFPSVGVATSSSTDSVCMYALRTCPRLFPLSARVSFVQEVFGHSIVSRMHLTTLHRTAVGCETRQSVTVRRENLGGDALRILHLVGASAFPLEVQFEGEVGSGSGVTTEFFTLVGLYLGRTLRDDMWVCGSVENALYPAPPPSSLAVVSPADLSRWWYVIGVLVARTLRDGRPLPLRLHEAFFRVLLGEDVSAKETLALVDPDMERAIQAIEAMGPADLDAAQLDFVAPRNGCPLTTNGEDISVTSDNVVHYVRLLREYHVADGIAGAMESVRRGINDVLPIAYLRIFSAAELVQVVCGNTHHKLWSSPEELWGDIVFGHGYDVCSAPVEALVHYVVSLDADAQRDFLMFVSGAREKPIGGLNPKITVVRKDAAFDGGAASADASHTLPTVNTCFHYLKLPPYDDVEVLSRQLSVAVAHGQQGFLLS